MSEVLAWLAEHHPALHKAAEPDRAWLWITANLKGDHNKAVRDSINHEGGFRFAKRGHTLPSGRVAFWGHSCSHPIGFKRKGGKPGKLPGAEAPAARNPSQRLDPLATTSPEKEALVAVRKDLDELAAAFV